jgi:hypothetical protein
VEPREERVRLSPFGQRPEQPVHGLRAAAAQQDDDEVAVLLARGPPQLLKLRLPDRLLRLQHLVAEFARLQTGDRVGAAVGEPDVTAGDASRDRSRVRSRHFFNLPD